MEKLLRGIAEFRRNRRPEFAAKFAKLALGQTPDVLFVACSDSRVVPNLFASTEPGDLFVIRNVGNIVPPVEGRGPRTVGFAESAAIEFAVSTLRVRHIVVCGHSECGAMRLLAERLPRPEAIDQWVMHAKEATQESRWTLKISSGTSAVNRVSQQNVLLQLEHLRTYPVIRDAEKEGRLRLHGWWFDIAHADVLHYHPEPNCFVVLDDQTISAILAESP